MLQFVTEEEEQVRSSFKNYKSNADPDHEDVGIVIVVAGYFVIYRHFAQKYIK